MLELRDVSAGYGDLGVLQHVSFDVSDREFVGVVGANAAGKTTLARVITGVIPSSGGDVLWDGQVLSDIPFFRRAELGIMMVPEGRALFPLMTVRENLEIGSTNPRGRKVFRRNLERMFEIFPILKEKERLPARSLSGGQQQMLAIGRALMGEPRLLILDEPSVGLAPAIVQDIYKLLKSVLHNEMAILLIEQDVRQCLKAVDRAVVMASGRVVLSGTATQILDSDDVRRAYLGV